MMYNQSLLQIKFFWSSVVNRLMSKGKKKNFSIPVTITTIFIRNKLTRLSASALWWGKKMNDSKQKDYWLLQKAKLYPREPGYQKQ